MLFNSWLFILVFLPVVLIGYFVLGRRSNVAAVVWLALASLAFYSLSNWQFVLLLLTSIAFNYGIGYLLIERKLHAPQRLAAVADRGLWKDQRPVRRSRRTQPSGWPAPQAGYPAGADQGAPA